MSVYVTPGPSQPYPRLREYMDDAWGEDIMAISHRGKKFTDVYRQTDAAVRELLEVPEDYTLMFLGSATEAMERAIQGVVASRSHHLVNGAFSEKWFQIAKQLGKQPSVWRAEAGRGFDLSSQAVPDDVELVCLTHNETSSGAAFPLDELERLTRLPHRPLVALDAVSSVPLVRLPWASLDLVHFSVQKAFGLPAGLGGLIASPRALERTAALQARGLSVGSFHSLPELAAGAAKWQTPATPNVLGIYLLGRVAADMLARGAEALRGENRRRAELIHGAIERNPLLRQHILDPGWRSTTVIVVEVEGGNAGLAAALEADGIIPGRGYGVHKDQHLRLANFPSVDAGTIEALAGHLARYGQ